VETREAQFERRMVDALRKQVPVKDLPGVRIAQVRQEPERPFDVSFELASGKNRILVFAEIKQAPSPEPCYSPRRSLADQLGGSARPGVYRVTVLAS
jgi:hypothetical protein